MKLTRGAAYPGVFSGPSSGDATKHLRRLIVMGAIVAVACRSSAPLWPELASTLPQGTALLEYRIASPHSIYWVDHRRIGSDLDRVIATIRSNGHSRVVVHSEYKLWDWGCALRARLVAAKLEVVSFLMPSPVAPGWTELNQDEFRCDQRTSR
jgi:hypothetical protein